MSQHTFFEDLGHLMDTIPPDSIVSRTVYSDDHSKAVLFGFAAGQELSEHTASQAAIIHILQGEASVTLGDTVHEAGPNSWMHLPPQLKHRVHARTALVMLLLLLKDHTA